MLKRSKSFTKYAQTYQDIRSISGVSTNAFGPQSWIFLNQLINELNGSLTDAAGTQKFGTAPIDVRLVISNPSISDKFAGSLKNVIDLILYIWYVISASTDKPYSVDATKNIINHLLDLINSANLDGSKLSSHKIKLTGILNNWLAIL